MAKTRAPHEAHILHAGERFPLFPDRGAQGLAWSCALSWCFWVALLIVNYLWPRTAMPQTEIFWAALLGAVISTGVCVAILPGLANVVVVGPSGLSLERFGRRLWLMPWDQVQAWQLEFDQDGGLVGVHVVPKHGRPRRLGLTIVNVSAGYYDGILAAAREHAPDLEELDPLTVNRFDLGCVLAVALVVIGVWGLWRYVLPH